MTLSVCVCQEIRKIACTPLYDVRSKRQRRGHEEEDTKKSKGRRRRGAKQRGLGKLSLESGPGIVAPCGGSRGTDYFRIKTNLARRGATRGSREAEKPSRVAPCRRVVVVPSVSLHVHTTTTTRGVSAPQRGEANGICAAIFRGLVPKRPCSRHRQHSVRSGHPDWQDSKPRGSPTRGSPTTISRPRQDSVNPVRCRVLSRENLSEQTAQARPLATTLRRRIFQGFSTSYHGLRNHSAKSEIVE